MVKDGTLVVCPLLLALRLSMACLRLTCPILPVTLGGFGYAYIILELLFVVVWAEEEDVQTTLERVFTDVRCF